MDDVVLTGTGVSYEAGGVQEHSVADVETKVKSTVQISDRFDESERKKLTFQPELHKVPVGSPLHSPSDVKKSAKKRPTHFVAARVSHSPLVLKAMETVQEALKQHNPALHAAFVEPVTSHLTLTVMPLDSAERLQAAQQALEGLQIELGTHGLKGPFSLDIANLSHFRRSYIWT